jgi:predicted acylesterase/phospholipase RssA
MYLCPGQHDPLRPRFSAAQAVDLYLEKGEAIFNIPLGHRLRTFGGVRDEKYPAAPLQDLLREYLGDTQLSQLLRPCLITAYDIQKRRAVLFNQQDAETHEGEDFLLRDVARATSAAPTYFECARISSMSGVRYALVDGGVFANNPSLCAYAEARKFADAPTARDMVLFSVGTGEQRRSYQYDEARDWGLAEWVVPVLDIMMSGVAETVDYQLRQMFDTTPTPHHYLRLQAPLDDRNADMDNVDPENLQELREIGQRLAEDNDEQLDQLIELLLAD